MEAHTGLLARERCRSRGLKEAAMQSIVQKAPMRQMAHTEEWLIYLVWAGVENLDSAAAVSVGNHKGHWKVQKEVLTLNTKGPWHFLSRYT